jgi:TusA-related sulfurtransferase
VSNDERLAAPVIAGLIVGIAVVVMFSLVFTPAASRPQSFTIDAVGERFTVVATDPETIRLLTENYEGKNGMHVTGVLVRGDGGFNSPWPWHLDPDTVRMAEISIELCDGRPSLIEEDLDYWLDTVGNYCPWSSKVVSINN